MPRDIFNSVIKYLKDRDYTYLYFRGTSILGDEIAVKNPAGLTVAVKIVKSKDIRTVEDQYWPRLHHKNLLQLYDIISVEELGVKLYISPLLSNSLYEETHSDGFRSDPNSFIRLKKWSIQVLNAMEYLGRNGLCHLEIRSENILIDDEDNALLSEFSGLTLTNTPVKRFTSWLFFRGPECFINQQFRRIQGGPLDVWSYGIVLLNAFTNDYFHKKTYKFHRNDVNWLNKIWPVLKKCFKEKKFTRLLKQAFPSVSLTSADIHQALNFMKCMLKIRPEERPTSSTLKQHLFLKMISNPFTKDYYDTFKSMNPFRKMQCSVDQETQLISSFSGTGTIHDSKEQFLIKDNPSKKKTDGGVKNWISRKFTKLFK